MGMNTAGERAVAGGDADLAALGAVLADRARVRIQQVAMRRRVALDPRQVAPIRRTRTPRR